MRTTVSRPLSPAARWVRFTLKLICQGYNLMTGRQLIHERLSRQAKPYAFGSWTPPAGYANQRIMLARCPAYLLHVEGKSSGRVIYQLHGGAYIGGFFDAHNRAALQYSQVFGQADVLSLDYRTAPKWVHPCALEDAVAGYEWLLARGYAGEEIVVAGDSAGGGLALALCMRLRDTARPLPHALLLASPWADFTSSGDSIQDNRRKDVLFGTVRGPGPRHPVPVTYDGAHDPRDPLLSPVFGSMRGLPPMLIQVGSDEMLLSDSVRIGRLAEAAGVRADVFVYAGMFHTFYTMAPGLAESKRAFRMMETFLSSL